MISKYKATTIFFMFLLVFSPGYPRANSAGYGEENENLGQFTDDFENDDNVSVAVNVINNQTLDCMELNQSTEISYGDFNKAVEIVIDPGPLGLDLNLTNFPVLLNISNSAGVDDDDITYIFDEIGNSYQKIAITNVEQDLEYYVEVEYWNRTEELGYLWVGYNVSRLENTTVRFFYDASAANNTGYVGLSGSVVASNVWDNDFLCVLHLNQETGNFNDSSRYNNDATEQGNGVARGQYIIDGGIDVAGTNDYARIENSAIDNNLGYMSVEAWVNADSYGSADKAVAGDWGTNQVFLLYFDRDPNNKWRMLFRDSLGGVKDVYFGDNPPLAGTLYYLGATFRTNSKVRGYQDGALTEGDVIGPGITVGSTNDKIAIGEEVDGGDKDWIGKIDEFRLSNMSRSTAYFIASNSSGRDDLVDWVISEEIAGYDTAGYFITTNYLDYVNGSSLAQLTNASIDPGTIITIQFSNDNVTWLDHEGNVGSDLLENGFYALDLRDLNYTNIWMRYNLSGPGNLTPRVYQSRLITTLGPGDIIIANETIVINNVTGEWIEYNLTEIGVIIGTHDSGFLNSTFVIDGDTYNCSEVVGAPGYIISFNWTGVDTESHCLWVVSYIFYDGVSAHEIHVELWNFADSNWVEIGNIYDMVDFEWVNSSIYALRMPNDYINSTGAVLGRFNHEVPGNINDDIHTEYLKLLAFIPTEAAPTTEDNFFWVFIAIVLSIIVGLLMWLKDEHNNN